MKQHIFLTRRPEILPTWNTAFPGASLHTYPAAGTHLASAGEALVWLHVAGDKPDPGLLVQEVALAAPGCPIIVLSNVPSDEEGLAVLEAGAVGYTNALAVPEVLHQVAAVVEHGGLWVGPALLQRLIAGMATRSAQINNSHLDKLSAREREVALAVAGGASNKEVARRLEISERTVKAHLTAAFERLGVRDRLQLSLLINGTPQSSQIPPKTVH
ncbi:response regulator transcription factor [Betaproteobacteria bacterium SCN2]|jgi:DNA-binding NarL/FixJ family response regulator|nr:response regulator transcription factor [Betaproteobacteria bacterium SCN2]